MGQIEEASRITQFWAETQAISADEVTIKDYITEFMKKYPCRGIPVVVDVLLAQRVQGQRASYSGYGDRVHRAAITMLI